MGTAFGGDLDGDDLSYHAFHRAHAETDLSCKDLNATDSPYG